MGDSNSADRTDGSGRYTLVYDGRCSVCTRTAELIRKWDGGRTLEVTPSQQPGVAERFHWIAAQDFQDSMQLVFPDGRTLQGAAAAEALLNILPRGCLVSWVFRVPLVRPLAERFYRWFARNRYRLGCGDHCAVRPGDRR